MYVLVRRGPPRCALLPRHPCGEFLQWPCPRFGIAQFACAASLDNL